MTGEDGKGEEVNQREEGETARDRKRRDSGAREGCGKQVTVGKKAHKRKDERHRGSKGHSDRGGEGKEGKIEEKLHIKSSER